MASILRTGAMRCDAMRGPCRAVPALAAPASWLCRTGGAGPGAAAACKAVKRFVFAAGAPRHQRPLYLSHLTSPPLCFPLLAGTGAGPLYVPGVRCPSQPEPAAFERPL